MTIRISVIRYLSNLPVKSQSSLIAISHKIRQNIHLKMEIFKLDLKKCHHSTKAHQVAKFYKKV